MLLQALKELTERPGFDRTPTLYVRTPVRYIIDLKADGQLASAFLIDTADPASRETKRGQPRLAPLIQRSSGVKPLLLADKADYVLGYSADDTAPPRTIACHAAFTDLIAECADDTEEPAVFAVQRFLAAAPLEQISLEDGFDPSGVITFRVEGQFVTDLPSVQRFWAAKNDPAANQAQTMQCLICGTEQPVLERLPLKIKGVPGGQTSGTSLISANAEAFESYGLSASLVAPTCSDCAERFTKAANDLLSHKESRVILGGAAFIFWTRENVQFDLLSLLDQADPDDVARLLDSVRTGTRTEVDEIRFYATSLSASGGRTVVRDWIDTTIGDAKESLGQWFEGQRIADPSTPNPRPYGLYALAAATVRDAQKDLATRTPRALVHTALTGTPLPTGLLAQALRRCRAEQGITRPRAALVRLVLRSQKLLEEDELVGLNSQHPDPAYHCGRLLAIIEDAQRAAIPGIKATVVDRFFGTASSSPASVFPRLLKGAQPHLSKLERDRRPVSLALQARLRDTLAQMDGFPRILTLEQQGLFALGFYHQHAFDRTRAREAAQRRPANQPPSPDEALVDAIETGDESEEESN